MDFLEKLKMLEASPHRDLDTEYLQARLDEMNKYKQNELDLCDAHSYCYLQGNPKIPITPLIGGQWSPLSRKKNPG